MQTNARAKASTTFITLSARFAEAADLVDSRKGPVELEQVIQLLDREVAAQVEKRIQPSCKIPRTFYSYLSS